MATKTFKLEYPMDTTRACRVSGGALPKDFSVVVPLTIQWNGANGDEIANLAVRSSIIEWQASARQLSVEMLKKLSKEGSTVHFRNTKFSDPEKRVAELVATGMPELIARMAVYEPEKYASFMEGALANLKK